LYKKTLKKTKNIKTTILLLLFILAFQQNAFTEEEKNCIGQYISVLKLTETSNEDKILEFVTFISDTFNLSIFPKKTYNIQEACSGKPLTPKQAAFLIKQLCDSLQLDCFVIKGLPANYMYRSIQSQKSDIYYWNIIRINNKLLYVDVPFSIGELSAKKSSCHRIVNLLSFKSIKDKLIYTQTGSFRYILQDNVIFEKYYPYLNLMDNLPFDVEIMLTELVDNKKGDNEKRLLTKNEKYLSLKQKAYTELAIAKRINKQIKKTDSIELKDSLADLFYDYARDSHKNFERLHRLNERGEMRNKSDNARLRIRESKKSNTIILKNKRIVKKYGRLVQKLKSQNELLKDQNEKLKIETEKIANTEIIIKKKHREVSPEVMEIFNKNLNNIFANSLEIKQLKESNKNILSLQHKLIESSLEINQETVDSIFLLNQELIQQSIIIKSNFHDQMLDDMIFVKDSILSNKIEIQKLKLKSIERDYTKLKIGQTQLRYNYRKISNLLKRNSQLLKVNHKLSKDEGIQNLAFNKETNNWIQTNIGFIESNKKNIEFNKKEIRYLKKFITLTKKESRSLKREIRCEQIRSRASLRYYKKEYKKEKRSMFSKRIYSKYLTQKSKRKRNKY
jgi:hypothetical protein